ncbi:MAG TPA: formate/nitrite transporter family protein [Acidobacteriaceae bacterium]|nr:formate/nitrite transporter family protein [Acidobacteriaceae bacterium]
MADDGTTATQETQAADARRSESGNDAQDTKQAGQGEGGDAASHQKNLERPSAEDIYQQVAENARTELKRSTTSLAISGFAGGIFMGLSALGTAITLGIFGKTPLTHFIAMMFYPIGFIVVIIGRAQLFTENTLYPVALVLAEKREFLNTARLWCTVLPANVLGALAFAALAIRTDALHPETQHALIDLGLTAAHASPSAVFWSAVTAGWIIATAAWLVSGSHSITGSVILLWLLTFVVGLGNFAHCIATSGEILSAVLAGQLALGSYLYWLLLAVAGNVCGGVVMVTLLEYGQAILAQKELPLEGEEQKA